ncbi:MAG: CBS domain-containing protein [Bdellovibrionales bacterium]|jgi:CBS domain-containing protein|nr:CBS domain-containing protein [Bdellovibrionales bacterium]
MSFLKAFKLHIPPHTDINSSFIAKDVMTKITCQLNEKTSIKDAIDILELNKISGAPVVDEKNLVVGFLSEKDCLKYLYEITYYRLPHGLVTDYMSKDVIALSEEDTDEHILALFVKSSFHLIPVVGQNNLLLGVVHRSRVLAKLKNFY